MADNQSGIRATDDKQLADSLWGEDKKWDEERQQYVPVEKDDKGGASSPGSSSQTSSDVTGKNDPSVSKVHQPTVPTTEQAST